MLKGGCRCGAIRYEVSGEDAHHALCHCRDCQRSCGAPVVAWSAFQDANFRITKGKPASYHGDGASIRHFCGNCGTPVYFLNAEVLPGIVDINSVTLDDPDAVTMQAHIQVAEQRPYMAKSIDLPEFDRYPPMD